LKLKFLLKVLKESQIIGKATEIKAMIAAITKKYTRKVANHLFFNFNSKKLIGISSKEATTKETKIRKISSLKYHRAKIKIKTRKNLQTLLQESSNILKDRILLKYFYWKKDQLKLNLNAVVVIKIVLLIEHP